MNIVKNLRRKGQTRWAVVFFALICALYLPAMTQAQSQWTTNGNDINNTNTGNVGVGTATPGAKLEIKGAGGGAMLFDPDLILVKSNNNGYELSIQGGFDTNTGGRIRLGGGARGDDGKNVIQFFQGTVERMRIRGGELTDPSIGFVGIGTTAPAGPLHVQVGSVPGWDRVVFNTTNEWGDGANYNYATIGAGGAEGIMISNPHITWRYNRSAVRMGRVGGVPGGAFWDAGLLGGDAWGVARNNDLGNPFMLINSGGNVGIGTTAPLDKLSVAGNISLPYGASLLASGFGINHRNILRTGYAGGGAGDYLSIYTAGGGIENAAEKIRIYQYGTVAIGTTDYDGNYKLHVAGNVRVDGNIAAKYQDVAEWVETTQQLAAGTVVVLDTERSNQVLAATEAYDTKVAGVVSAQPGLILGEEGVDKVKVATTGRVRVKVDATKGAIKVGDLLVTSGEAGVAMKSEPLLLGSTPIHRPGTLIGKALEPLASGKGEILVLLSLQ